nr:probable cyclin-dependent serine/threonine-protein kinase DDB_G0292550 isoform X2 [Dermatophagoides farinae]
MISTTTGMANTTSTSTPIRPRPILASAFSFDSGYEISPFSNYSFQFGTESIPNTILTNNNNNSIMATNRLLNPIVQEDYEGIDDELISIDQHFTPIHSPATVENMANGQIDSSSSLMNHFSQRQQAFNLAIQRRENRLIQNEMEINNNDPNYPNAENQYFSFDDFGDDEVFLDNENDDSQPERIMAREWHQPIRPSCSMGIMYDNNEIQDNNNVDDENQVQIDHSYREPNLSTTSSSTSRCSSEPIPIPGARNRYRSSPLLDNNDDLSDFFDGTSASHFMAEQNEQEFSLPDSRRMPYFHRMAPRLLNDNNDYQRHRFGSRFQLSLSMIQDYRDHSECHCSTPSTLRMPSGFSFRFGHQSPNQILYESRRLLTPLPEMDEENDENLIFPMSLDEHHVDDHEEQTFRIMEPIMEQSMNTNEFNEQIIVNDSSSSLNNDDNCPSSMDVDLVPLMDRRTNSCGQCLDYHHRQHNNNDNDNDVVVNTKKTITPLPDVVLTPRLAANRSNNEHHQRNTLLSFHEVPYHHENGGNDSFSHNHHHHSNERRTMSVSLPIDQETITEIGRELRQISYEFHMLQIQRSINLAQMTRSQTDGSVNNQQQQPNNIAINIIRLMLELLTFTSSSSSSSSSAENSTNQIDPTSSIFTINNSIFYTGSSLNQSPSSSSTQNSATTLNDDGNDEMKFC